MESLFQQAAAAEAGLRRGQIEATIDYGNGNRSSAQVRFDLGDGQAPRRLHIASVSNGPAGSQRFEQILIGERGWQHQPDGRWARVDNQDGMWDQLAAYLPQLMSAREVQLAGVGGTASTTVLRWYDPILDADTALEVDSVTGIPRQMRQVARKGTTVVVVDYRDWNAPVDITPPTET